MKTLLILSSSLLLTGCVAVWGQSYHIQSQDSAAIEIRYDTNFTTFENITKIAQDHCAGYGKTAALQKNDMNLLHLTTASFKCVDHP